MIPVLYSSSSMGKEDYRKYLKDRTESVSITVDDGFCFSDTADFKVYIQIEPSEVIDVRDKLIENQKFYDLILAWDEKILSHCPNAILFPHCETLGEPLFGVTK